MNQELEQAIVKYGNETWNDGYGQGVFEEKERIIKLVKKWQEDLITGSPYTTEELAQHRDNGYKDGFDYLIALIKGEK